MDLITAKQELNRSMMNGMTVEEALQIDWGGLDVYACLREWGYVE